MEMWVQPDALSRCAVCGHVLSSHVVAVEGRRLIFVSRRLASERSGNIVGVGDMWAQIRQVGENICAALGAGGATLNDLVEMTTFVSDIKEFFLHVDVRAECFDLALPTSTTGEIRRLSHPGCRVEVKAIAVTARAAPA